MIKNYNINRISTSDYTNSTFIKDCYEIIESWFENRDLDRFLFFDDGRYQIRNEEYERLKNGQCIYLQLLKIFKIKVCGIVEDHGLLNAYLAFRNASNTEI